VDLRSWSDRSVYGKKRRGDFVAWVIGDGSCHPRAAAGGDDMENALTEPNAVVDPLVRRSGLWK
jgi:hypothetical protein